MLTSSSLRTKRTSSNDVSFATAKRPSKEGRFAFAKKPIARLEIDEDEKARNPEK